MKACKCPVALWLLHLVLLAKAASSASCGCQAAAAAAEHNVTTHSRSDSGGGQQQEMQQPLPPGVKVVHYPLVQTPVVVECEQFNLGQLGKLLPCSVDLLQELPPGMAFRGGLARNLLKALHGQPEPDYHDCDQLDIDVLAVVPDGSPAAVSSAVRQQAKQLRLSGRRLAPGDVEVLQQSQLPSYFAMRDVTMNEVLLLARSHNTAMLCYSQQALQDVQLRIARPAVHSLRQSFHMAWDLEADGTTHIAFALLRRCLVRLLKGHATSYALDESSWRFYRQRKLQLQQLFQILRPFQRRNPAALGAVVHHLVSSGLVDGRLLLTAGSVERLWQLALQAASASFGPVAVEHQRLIRAASDVDNVALWELWGQQQVVQHMQNYMDSCKRTGWMPADESVASLGLLQIPEELLALIMHGPTFNISMNSLET